MKYWLIVSLTLLSGCASKYRIEPETSIVPLAQNEAYLSFVIDSLDPLYSIQMKNVDTGEEFYVGHAPIGLSQITLKIPEAEYCFIGYDVYNFRVDFNDSGFCTYVEAGDLNYFGEFIVRNPVTTIKQDFSQFVRLLKDEKPELCSEYIIEGCNL